MALQSGKQAICIGIMAADPLRSIGLQSILEEGLHVRTVLLPDEARPRSSNIDVLIVDQGVDGELDLSAPLQRTLLHLPGAPVVLLARSHAPVLTNQTLAARACAVLPETAQVAEIRACIRAVLRGKTWTPREKPTDSDGSEGGKDPKPVPLAQRLTPKERAVLGWLTQGHSNREIATIMGIDEATVKAHLGRMLRKGEASNRVELTLRALAEEKVGA